MLQHYGLQLLESDEFPFRVKSFHFLRSGHIPKHKHDFVELVFITQGRAEHLLHDNMSPITEGDVLVIPPGTEHGYVINDDTSFAGTNLLFLPRLLEKELALLYEVASFVDFFYIEPFLRSSTPFLPHFNLSTRDRPQLKLILEQLVQEFERKQPSYRVMVKTKLIELMILLSRCYDNQSHGQVCLPSDDKELMMLSCRFIEQHYNKPLTLEQVSRFCGMSASSFKVKFKQHTGSTFLDYRNELRLRMAKKLLADTQDKVILVAEQVGFNDLSHFYRAFKERYGVTPRDYRQQLAAKNKESNR